MKRIINSAYIELTSHCNLKCKHCYNNSGKNEYKLCLNKLQTLTDGLIKYNCSTIFISGGEPLLYEDLDKVFEIMAGRFTVRLVTNGTLLNEESAKKLCQYVDEFQISIDGTSENEHDKIRGIGTFKKAIRGISYLNDKGKKIITNTVVLGNNNNNIKKFIDLLKTYKVGEINFRLLNNIGRAKENQLASTFTYKQYDELCSIIENKNKEEKIQISLNKAPSGECPILNDDMPLHIRIDFKGDVFLCQRFLDSLFSIGNINYQNLESMLVSEEYIKLIHMLDNAKSFVIKCRSCDYNVICSKPCPGDILNDGIFNYEDVFCQSRLRSTLPQ